MSISMTDLLEDAQRFGAEAAFSAGIGDTEEAWYQARTAAHMAHLYLAARERSRQAREARDRAQAARYGRSAAGYMLSPGWPELAERLAHAAAVYAGRYDRRALGRE